MIERWFISYRIVAKDFFNTDPHSFTLHYNSVITDISPAKWMREHGANYHILYAEQISTALASELVHGLSLIHI